MPSTRGSLNHSVGHEPITVAAPAEQTKHSSAKVSLTKSTTLVFHIKWIIRINGFEKKGKINGHMNLKNFRNSFKVLIVPALSILHGRHQLIQLFVWT